MRLLLDTHIWLWSLLEPRKLNRRVVKQLKNEDNELWLSPISIWEILILCEKKRLSFRPGRRLVGRAGPDRGAHT